ncbi:MAG: hypothetical protein QF890_16045 [Myxococcota bacterium]|jgi:epoxyqueuosine reductase QueG|nr:hypothetical protein [Deltaproteobacteria bacterium]MCP4242487.1 hypothetical protein [bacterium]MDP6073459.1 hypothetical protein [Myxococcota bacterium]MDP7075172.1 hypothetical protein [Myxococcota bacterium]MDP7298853.1 hypothetical protein [Myxococcota bacterium]
MSGVPDSCTPGKLALSPILAAAGFNAAGVLSARGYDALVPSAWQTSALLPGARALVVLGCGGREFGEAFQRAPEAQSTEHPVDRFTARVVDAAADALREQGHETRALYYWERRAEEFADFVALGRACGLGATGRLGVLLHPTYGPWISLRALLLTRREIGPTSPEVDFTPCPKCPAPCASACEGDAVGIERFDKAACLSTALIHAECRTACPARRACVLGHRHVYPPALERRYRSAVISAVKSRS